MLFDNTSTEGNAPIFPIAMVVVIIGVIIMPLGLLMGVIALAILHWQPRMKWLILVMSLVLVAVTFRAMPFTINAFFTLHHHALMSAFHGTGLRAFDPYLWISAFAFSGIFGVLLHVLLGRVSTIQRHLKRVSQGQGIQSATFLSEKKIQKALDKIHTSAIPGGSILGVNQMTGEPVILTDKQANCHVLVLGTTGSGKTVTLCNMIESIIQRGLMLIILDGKGDVALANRIEAYAKQHNRKCHVFKMQGQSAHYNPIASGGITSKKDRIIELRTWSEDHYRKIAEGYLQTIFQLIERFKIQVDLFTLSKYLRADKFYDLARAQKDEAAITLIESLEGREKDVSSLLCEIENMVNSEIGDLFNTQHENSFNLKQALDENAIVYFCLQPLAFPAYAECLGKLIINDIKALAASQLSENKNNPIYCLFDEFSIFAGDQIVNLINQGRSAGIHAILSTQSLCDIERKGDQALIGQIVNNCNHFIIQRQNHHDDAERSAQLIGTTDGFQLTSKIESKPQATQTGTVRLTKEFIVHPDDIKRLKQGEGIIVNKQQFRVEIVGVRRSKI